MTCKINLKTDKIVVVQRVEHLREALYFQRLVCGDRRFILLNSFLDYSLPQCLWSGFSEHIVWSIYSKDTISSEQG
jgi:hypothetical protein